MTSLALTHAPSLCRTPFRCSTPSLQCRLYPHAAPTNSHIMTSQLGPFVCLLCVASCECTRLLNPQGIANGPQDLSAHQRRRKELYLKRKQSLQLVTSPLTILQLVTSPLPATTCYLACNLLPRLCLLPSLLQRYPCNVYMEHATCYLASAFCLRCCLFFCLHFREPLASPNNSATC